MTIHEIAVEYGVSRTSVHNYRRSGTFPRPAPVEGTEKTKLRFQADEVAAWFEANPKQQGKRTDLADKQQGEPAVSGYRHSGMSREDYEDCQALLDASSVIERRWPDEHSVLRRDLRDLVDTIGEGSEE
jgi:predicted DNA-binding transcriptional regulator AlpA